MTMTDAWAVVVLGGFAVTGLAVYFLATALLSLSESIKDYSGVLKWSMERLDDHASRLADLDDAACCTTLELHRLEARLDAVEAATGRDTFHE